MNIEIRRNTRKAPCDCPKSVRPCPWQHYEFTEEPRFYVDGKQVTRAKAQRLYRKEES